MIVSNFKSLQSHILNQNVLIQMFRYLANLNFDFTIVFHIRCLIFREKKMYWKTYHFFLPEVHKKNEFAKVIKNLDTNLKMIFY